MARIGPDSAGSTDNQDRGDPEDPSAIGLESDADTWTDLQRGDPFAGDRPTGKRIRDATGGGAGGGPTGGAAGGSGGQPSGGCQGGGSGQSQQPGDRAAGRQDRGDTGASSTTGRASPDSRSSKQQPDEDLCRLEKNRRQRRKPRTREWAEDNPERAEELRQHVAGENQAIQLDEVSLTMGDQGVQAVAAEDFIDSAEEFEQQFPDRAEGLRQQIAERNPATRPTLTPRPRIDIVPLAEPGDRSVPSRPVPSPATLGCGV